MGQGTGGREDTGLGQFGRDEAEVVKFWQKNNKCLCPLEHTPLLNLDWNPWFLILTIPLQSASFHETH